MSGSPPSDHGYPPQSDSGQQAYAPQQGYGQPQQGYAQPHGGAHPNAPYGIDPKSGLPYSDKQKLVAGLLQVLLAGFAVGRFYTGHTGMAVAQLAVTWLTCGAGALWPLIDGIMMLVSDDIKDANGLPLRPN